MGTLVRSPGAALRWMATAAFPWGGILYTGLLSTDLALLIEVASAGGPVIDSGDYLLRDRRRLCTWVLALGFWLIRQVLLRYSVWPRQLANATVRVLGHASCHHEAPSTLHVT